MGVSTGKWGAQSGVGVQIWLMRRAGEGTRVGVSGVDRA